MDFSEVQLANPSDSLPDAHDAVEAQPPPPPEDRRVHHDRCTGTDCSQPSRTGLVVFKQRLEESMVGKGRVWQNIVDFIRTWVPTVAIM